jgi:hypothetical protein
MLSITQYAKPAFANLYQSANCTSTSGAQHVLNPSTIAKNEDYLSWLIDDTLEAVGADFHHLERGHLSDFIPFTNLQIIPLCCFPTSVILMNGSTMAA